jgi:phosphoribosylamine--glycine ligase
MGDPETEVVIPRMAESLSDILASMKSKDVKSRVAKAKEGYCTTVFGVSGGYPQAYKKGVAIQISEGSETLFHAGTKQDDGNLVTSGGRVLAATAFGSSMSNALSNSYSLLDQVKFDGMYFRKDIGKDLMEFVK